MLKKNEILDDALELLMVQMIRENFENKNIHEEKFIITKQELYEFSIKLIKWIRDVDNE